MLRVDTLLNPKLLEPNANHSRTRSARTRSQPAQLREEPIFQSHDILVTKTRLVILGQTWPMAGLTSFTAVRKSPSYIAPVIPVICGVLLVMAVAESGILGSAYK